MNIVDRGSGQPLVLIPGLQGRWEYMRPAVDALSTQFRVITFSLFDEPSFGAGASARAPRPADLNPYADQIAAVLDAKNLAHAIVVGVSFGGVVAVRFAARYQKRCDALILASTPKPGLRLRRKHEIYVRAPWIFGPVFLVESPWRLGPEVCAAIPDLRGRLRLACGAMSTLVRSRVSASRMAARARLLSADDVRADCERIAAPTLILTGERGLDHVVPPEGSSEYLTLIPGARAYVLERTGHLGTVTRPDAFAAAVRDFVERASDAAA